MNKLQLLCSFVIFASLIQTGLSIQCYECNSHKDSRCAYSHPPDDLKKDCTQSEKGNQHTMCRKIVQQVEFEVNGMPPDNRVIRTCGWDDSKYKGQCYVRGGFGGKQQVCSCSGDFCNEAGRPSASLFSAITILLLLYFHIMSKRI